MKQLGPFASVWPDHGDFRPTPVNGQSQDRRACLKAKVPQADACIRLVLTEADIAATGREVSFEPTDSSSSKSGYRSASSADSGKSSVSRVSRPPDAPVNARIGQHHSRNKFRSGELPSASFVAESDKAWSLRERR